jgi:hypothetical protein
MSIVYPYEDADDLRVALACLCVLDEQQIRKHRLPALYSSGVRYRSIHGPARCKVKTLRETCERFLSARQLLAERFGDCKDLCAYRVAELWLKGDRAARAFPIRTDIGWHIKVRHGDGRIEDPSIRLGMK